MPPLNAIGAAIGMLKTGGAGVSSLPFPDAWAYRKSHTITGTVDGAQTDYQVKITVHIGVTADSGNDVYIASGKVNTDFSDVRFTDSSGTLLDVWRQELTTGNNAVFWVEVPSIGASPATEDIYIYYGAPAASLASDGEATFIFFDDFDYASKASGLESTDFDSFGWTDARDPIIADGGTDDDTLREIGNVLYEPTDTGKEYKTWYTGVPAAGNEDLMYAYASDPDGPWTKGNSGGHVTTDAAEDPYCIKVGSTYHVFAEEKTTATDIVRYDFTNPETARAADATVLTPGTGGNWDDNFVQSPLVYEEGGTYYLFYEGGKSTGSAHIGLATASSVDGTYTRDATDNGRVINRSIFSWMWSDADAQIVPDDIIKIGSTYYMTIHLEVDGDNHWRVAMAKATSLTGPWTDVTGAEIPHHWFKGQFGTQIYQDGNGDYRLHMIGKSWRIDESGGLNDLDIYSGVVASNSLVENQSLSKWTYLEAFDDAGSTNMFSVFGDSFVRLKAYEGDGVSAAPDGRAQYSAAVALKSATLGSGAPLAVLIRRRSIGQYYSNFGFCLNTATAIRDLDGDLDADPAFEGNEICIQDGVCCVNLGTGATSDRMYQVQAGTANSIARGTSSSHVPFSDWVIDDLKMLGTAAANEIVWDRDGTNYITNVMTANVNSDKSVYIGQGILAGSSINNAYHDVDWVAVRVTTETEPVHTSWGSEEAL